MQECVASSSRSRSALIFLWRLACNESPPILIFRRYAGALGQDGGGSIDSKELKDLMASVGQNPTDDELAEMIRIADADGTGARILAVTPPPIRNAHRSAEQPLLFPSRRPLSTLTGARSRLQATSTLPSLSHSWPIRWPTRSLRPR